MFYGRVTTFTYENFKELLDKEDYNNLIYNCYYCSNQPEILGYLEKHLSHNNFIINYIYIRNSFNMGLFSDPDKLRKCSSLAFKTLFTVVCHINIFSELNKHFEVLDILIKKFDEKFNKFVTIDIFDFALNHSKKEMLNFIDTMSANISSSGTIITEKKKIDLPEPYLICNVTQGAWRYPAIKYIDKSDLMNIETNQKFIKNYSGRCQKYYEAYQYTCEKFNLVRNELINTNIFSLSKIFL